MDFATAFLQSDKFKKDELPPPLVSDGDDEVDDKTLNLKEGLDNNMTSHDSSINIHRGREAGQDRDLPSPRVTNEQGSRTGRSSISELSQEKDHQELRMMFEDLRSLTEEQMATSNARTLSAYVNQRESMRSLVELHDKPSKMIKIIMNQMTDNNVEESGTTNVYKDLGKLEGEDQKSTQTHFNMYSASVPSVKLILWDHHTIRMGRMLRRRILRPAVHVTNLG
jgi:hypothetical protein